MLTDYERYQLEWMIEHGHSLDELMAELTYYQNDLEATRGVNLTVSDVFDAWTSDRGFASLENDVITKDMIRAGIEHGVIRFEANPDPNDPWKTVCAIGNGWFYHVDTTDIPPDEYIRMNSRNVDMVVDEIYDELNSTVKSDYHDDFKRYLAVLNEEHHGGTNSLTGIPFDINETMENGGAYYNPERGIVIASFLLEQTSPRIEAYYGYTPYALASLIGKNADVTVDSDVMDIQDILADPSLPRRFDHELASFDSVEELIASRWSPVGAGWLDMSGHDGLASAMGALDIKQTDNVREWYTLAFPGDELAVGINPSLTFDDAIAAVPTGDGFYTALGDAADSLLRERIFEELCNRYGYTYDEVYDSWLNESPLPSPAISQQPEKIAVAAGYRFNLVDTRETSGIDLKGCGTVVTVDGHDYEIMKASRPLGRPAKHPPSSQRRMAAPRTPPARMSARSDVKMELDRNAMSDVDDTTVSISSSLHEMQTPSDDGSDAHGDGHAILRESVQTTSHGRVVSNAVHERPVFIHGESARARAAAAVLAANMDAEKEEKHRDTDR